MLQVIAPSHIEQFQRGRSATIRVDASDGTVRRGEPVTCGVPWPRGLIGGAADITLVDGDGSPQPCQVQVADHWPDGSVRWTLLDWFAWTTGGGQYRIGQCNEPAPQTTFTDTVKVQQVGAGVVVDTGLLQCGVQPGATFPFKSLTIDGQAAIDIGRSGFVGRDDKDRPLTANANRVSIEAPGPNRATVKIEGTVARAGGRPYLDLLAYVHFFAGSATVRFDLTLTNPRRAGHRRGMWDLGGRGSVYLRDASVTVALPSPNATFTNDGDTIVRCSPEPAQPYQTYRKPIELYQDSSGGENYKSTNHINRQRQVPIRLGGYRLTSADEQITAYRATPVVTLERGGRHLAMTMPHFWQNFPKAIEATDDALTLRLFPKQFADVHEIQGGEQKTHTFHIAFDRDQVTDEPLSWCRSPLHCHADPDWYANAQAVPYMTPRRDDPHAACHQLVDAAIEGDDTFEHKREVIDEYGWRHFGDIYADHEATQHAGPTPLISHYNNQYDAVAGFANQYLCTGDHRWFTHMDELAKHVVDIDVYHTGADKSAYNHGMFWHTCHYVDADTCGHRTYPRSHPSTKNVPGGGPSGGHLYTTGLILHYFLTGNPLSRDTVIELGQYVIDADDGSKTIFRFFDRGHTGHVTQSGFAGYHGPGRAPANAVNALLDAHRLSLDQKFLDKAEQLIRRSVHPADDIDALDLLDVERKWFYTMFLQTLGKHLDYKAQRGELDRMFAYAQTVLVNYATWMADHERPYLDEPQKLQYPTETWAAQELRKSQVFKFAARHASHSLRDRFLERGRFFFDYAVNTLHAMPTRTLCRPVVLMMTHGFSQAWFDQHVNVNPAPIPAQRHDFSRPETFITQKSRAKSKVLRLATGRRVRQVRVDAPT